MSLARKLAQLKKRLHLTTEEIAAQSGVPLGTLNKIFAGQTQNPSPVALLQIAKVLNTPVCYLLDNGVPLSYSTAVWADTCGLVSLAPDEMHLLELYRRLPPLSRRTFTAVANEMLHKPISDVPSRPTRHLVCYIPLPHNQRSLHGDTFLRKSVMVASDPIAQRADFAIQLISASMEPVYPMGTVLLCKQCVVAHNQFGLFQLNQESYVRKLYQNHGITKLVPTNVDLKSITVRAKDEFKCVGAILGPACCYSWES